MPEKSIKTIFLSASPGQTRRAGRVLAEEVLKTRPGRTARVIGLAGELGGGKTTFLQGFAKGLGIREKVLSPTFILIKKFQIRERRFQKPSKKSGGRIPETKTFFHIDCYRIQKPKEILDLGFKKITSDPKNIVAVEWADKIKKIMPQETVWLKFEFVDRKTRKIMIE